MRNHGGFLSFFQMQVGVCTPEEDGNATCSMVQNDINSLEQWIIDALDICGGIEFIEGSTEPCDDVQETYL